MVNEISLYYDARSKKNIKIDMYATVESSWKPNSDALGSDRAHNARTVADVIAELYSSTTFVSLRSHSHNKESGTFQKCHFLHFHFKKCLSLKFRNWKLCKVGSICTANGLSLGHPHQRISRCQWPFNICSKYYCPFAYGHFASTELL